MRISHVNLKDALGLAAQQLSALSYDGTAKGHIPTTDEVAQIVANVQQIFRGLTVDDGIDDGTKA